MKRIVSLGAAFLFVLSAGMTSYAGHHTPCITRIIQGSSLCWYGESRVGGHHLFGHDGWTDCGDCGVDVGAICGGWEKCHDGYGTGTAYSRQGMSAAPESRPAAGNQAEAQTWNGTGEAGTETYSTDAGYQNYNGAGYGGGGHCYSGSYTTGHHGSGHHGRGHH